MRGRRISFLVLLAACDRSSQAPAARGPQRLDPPAAAGAMAPNLLATTDGAWLTWLEPVGANAHQLRISRLTGDAWSTPVTVAEGPRIVANWADVPSLVRQDDGTLVAHWAEKVDSPVAHAYDVVLARSKDGGATWQRLGSPHRDGTASEHGFVSLVPDGNATLAMWLDGRAAGAGGATMLRAARIGETLGEEQIVDDRVCDCCSTAAIATASGPAIVYRDRSEKERRDTSIARRTAAGWTASAVHEDGWEIAGCPVNGPAIAAGGGTIAVAWYTYAAQRGAVKVAFSGDGGATFDRPIDVDEPRGARAPIGRVDVVVDRDEAIVSWTASEREDGELLVRRVARDRRRGAELSIATIAAARAGGFPKMEPVADDLVLAWTDTHTRTLRAARIPRATVPPVGVDQDRAVASQQASFPVGSRAPAYAAVRLDGTAASLAALRGSPVLVNVWATWCEPCRHELPALAKLQRRLGAGPRIVAVSVDRERPDRIGKLVARLAPELETWHDPDDRASTAFGVMTLPTTLLFDRDGVLVWRRDGAILDGDRELESALAHVR